jgi:hypothetical protein
MIIEGADSDAVANSISLREVLPRGGASSNALVTPLGVDERHSIVVQFGPSARKRHHMGLVMFSALAFGIIESCS